MGQPFQMHLNSGLNDSMNGGVSGADTGFWKRGVKTTVKY